MKYGLNCLDRPHHRLDPERFAGSLPTGRALASSRTRAIQRVNLDNSCLAGTWSFTSTRIALGIDMDFIHPSNSSSKQVSAWEAR